MSPTDNKTLTVLTTITDIFLQANVAAPIISGAVMAIFGIVKAITGRGPRPSEIADMLEGKLGKTEAKIRAEIARMEDFIGP